MIGMDISRSMPFTGTRRSSFFRFDHRRAWLCYIPRLQVLLNASVPRITEPCCLAAGQNDKE
jgi:hypothetical protein